MTPPEPAAVGVPSGDASRIYDLGYRRYDGPRLGRRAAVAALVTHSLRAAFGLGRPGRAKIAPWGLAAIALLPAGVSLAVAAVSPVDASPFNYDNYLWQMQSVFGLFIAAQAPELVGGDQRHRTLALYFSHALQRSDYALAKLGALAIALFIVLAAPLVLLFVGTILTASDVVGAFGDELSALPEVIGSPLIHAIPLAALGLAIAAFTPRRAYATGAIIALFLVGNGVSEALANGTTGALRDFGPMVNPFVWIDATRAWIFGGPVPESPASQPGAPDLVVQVGIYAVVTAVAIGLTLWRYRRIEP